MQAEVNGKVIELSEAGWLVNLDEWSPELAVEVAKNEKILINAGQRGKMILMSPVDIQKTLTCTLASVSQ